MHRFGWQWSYYPHWNAILLWGAASSYGMHGPRTCAIWGYFVSNCWHDCTWGQILLLTESRIIFSFLLFRDDFTVRDIFCLQREDYITLRDLKGCKLSGNVFNILFNLNKFMAFESRDPFLIRQVNLTFDWFSWTMLDFMGIKWLWFISLEWQQPHCHLLFEQEREEPTLTDWDRFAHREYIRLSMEEDVENVSNGSAEVWDESLEAPF